MKPSLGRIVIYILTDEDKKHLAMVENVRINPEDPKEAAAFIAHAESNEETALCNLFVMNKYGAGLFVEGVAQGDQPGTWHEPPRV
jgi:hypothetical protein